MFGCEVILLVDLVFCLLNIDEYENFDDYVIIF